MSLLVPRSLPNGMTIPNLITVGRLIIVPLVVVTILDGNWLLAFLLFALAGISDALDGFIAKRFDMASELGAYLDPLADKALIVSIYVTLAVVGALPVWLVALVVARDLMIVAAVLLSQMLARPVTIRPLLISKLNTAAQIGFAALMLATRAFGVDAGMATGIGLALVALLTAASMAAYLALWLRHMAS
jgi:cardiolipin synthase